MSSAFQKYNEAMAAFTQKIVESSEAINANRSAHVQAVKSFEEKVLEDADTRDAEAEIAHLNAEFEILNYRASALNKANGKKGTNSYIRKAAQIVIAENTKAMQMLLEKYAGQKKELDALTLLYLQKLVALGELYREGGHLREECNIAMTDAGMNLGVASPGDELFISRRKGWIFMDHSAIANAFINGELPKPEFTGIYTGTPRPKIGTGFQPLPADPDQVVEPDTDGDAAA
jgi:hypothetical protein